MVIEDIRSLDNRKNLSGYSLIAKFDINNTAIATNNNIYVFDIYYIGAYSTYGRYYKFAIVPETNRLKITELSTTLLQNQIENLFAYKKINNIYYLYLKTLYKDMSLCNRVVCYSFSNPTSIILENFEDIVVLDDTYTYYSTVKNNIMEVNTGPISYFNVLKRTITFENGVGTYDMTSLIPDNSSLLPYLFAHNLYGQGDGISSYSISDNKIIIRLKSTTFTGSLDIEFMYFIKNN